MTAKAINLFTKEIHHALMHDPRVVANKIIVEVKGSSVILKGKVPSFTSITVAEKIAKKVSGGRVKNYLKSDTTPLFADP